MRFGEVLKKGKLAALLPWLSILGKFQALLMDMSVHVERNYKQYVTKG